MMDWEARVCFFTWKGFLVLLDNEQKLSRQRKKVNSGPAEAETCLPSGLGVVTLKVIRTRDGYPCW